MSPIAWGRLALLSTSLLEDQKKQQLSVCLGVFLFCFVSALQFRMSSHLHSLYYSVVFEEFDLWQSGIVPYIYS